MAIKTINENQLLYFAHSGGQFKTTAPVALESVLDNFEQASIRISRPDGQTPETTLMWNQYEGGGVGRLGSEQLTTNEAQEGSKSLEITLDASTLFMQFYNTISGTEKAYARELALSPGAWDLDTYNRLEFFVKLPDGIELNTTTTTNCHLGTYFRGINGGRNSNESDGGWHFYHYFNLSSSGRWHKCIIDFHPSTSRAGGRFPRGNEELGIQQYPTNQSGYNYFDLMTRIYFTYLPSFAVYPQKFYFDRFRFYKEQNVENEQQVYSIAGVFIPSTNKLQVTWKRDKTENNLDHQVAYSFSSVHSVGWSGATLAPNGTITPTRKDGYNGMTYETTAIDVGVNTSIFVAVKPVNSSLFKQIEISVV